MRTICPYVRWLRRSAHFPFVLALAVSTSSAEAQTQVNPQCTIASTEFKFSQPSTPIVAGRPVTIVLNNSEGETEHSIVVPALGLHILARAGEVVKKDYTFETPGEYEFVCDLPGHKEAGMKGKLSVITGDGGQAKGHGATKK
jgi:uncharacterized cupredoxin-like copper-binding protein